ncbi:MAG: LysR family transcriptional regulator [Mailhella sp.]|nr:LysR family transcriptional regulator [Mailhella sp.]
MMKVPVTLHYRLWIERDGDYVLGNGVAVLLKHIDELGSLKRAAEVLKIPYRGAWGRIRKAEDALGMPLIASTSDRHKGVTLSPEAHRLLEAFRTLDELCRTDLLRRVDEQHLEGLTISGVSH